MRRPAPHAKLDWYPDPASGIHDAPSRMGVGGFLGWIQAREEGGGREGAGGGEKRISRGNACSLRIYRD